MPARFGQPPGEELRPSSADDRPKLAAHAPSSLFLQSDKEAWASFILHLWPVQFILRHIHYSIMGLLPIGYLQACVSFRTIVTASSLPAAGCMVILASAVKQATMYVTAAIVIPSQKTNFATDVLHVSGLCGTSYHGGRGSISRPFWFLLICRHPGCIQGTRKTSTKYISEDLERLVGRRDI